MRAGLLLTLLLVATPVQADFIIDVYGVAGTGQTEWFFSGTSTVPFSLTQNAGQIGGLWNDIGEYVAITDFDHDFVQFTNSSAIAVGSSSGLVNISGMYLDGDNVGFDDIGWLIADQHSFVANETFTYSGQGTLPVDLNQFSTIPSFPATFSRAPDGWGLLTLNFHGTAVPEPSGVAGLLLIGAALCARSRRSRSRCAA